jgi:hypothetical protein
LTFHGARANNRPTGNAAHLGAALQLAPPAGGAEANCIFLSTDMENREIELEFSI